MIQRLPDGSVACASAGGYCSIQPAFPVSWLGTKEVVLRAEASHEHDPPAGATLYDLPDDLPLKEDPPTMGASVEGRMPYLEAPLIRVATRRRWHEVHRRRIDCSGALSLAARA